MKKLKGLTLIEVLLALGVSAIIIVGAIAFFASASTSARVSQARGEIQGLVASIASLYAGQPNYTGISIASLNNAGKVPAGIGAAGRNPFGGTYVIAPIAGNLGYTITLNNVPRESCIELVTSQSLGSAGIYGVNAGAAASTAPFGGATPTQPTLTDATSATMCGIVNSARTVTFFAR